MTRHSFGGDVVLESRQGDVRQAAGATLDVSARGSDAGTVKATAANGQVALEGDLIARAKDEPDNGFEGGSIQVEGLTILDFVGLNQRLGDGVGERFRASRRSYVSENSPREAATLISYV